MKWNAWVKENHLPGPKSKMVLDQQKKTNLGGAYPYPFVQTNKGEGCYFKDLDDNIFLDFASQIASNPLGYSHPDLVMILNEYAHCVPIKCAGQDFIVKEHQELLNELVNVLPQGIDAGFLSNSGAEAVENALKLSFYHKPTAKYGISFKSAFHGRTLGALSTTNSKSVHKKHMPSFCMRHISYSSDAIADLERLIDAESDPKDIAFIIFEPVQGEGGYNIAPPKMVANVKRFAYENKIFLIVDEVQSGMGRTGKWWAIQHYDIVPDILVSAKALQVGATLSRHDLKVEPGVLSSTWGGGHILDLAMGIQIIRTIRKTKLLSNCSRMGDYLQKRLDELSEKYPQILNIRGKGLMMAFDLPTAHQRNNAILKFLQNGLITLGCGKAGVRLIPPYIISSKEIDEAMEIIDRSLKEIIQTDYRHKGEICNYINCGIYIT